MEGNFICCDNDMGLYVSPDELDVFSFFYYPDQNVFKDYDGYIIWDLFNYITPNDLYLFRRTETTMFIKHKKLDNTIIEIYYPAKSESYYYDHDQEG
jgi:hypothetical protein